MKILVGGLIVVFVCLSKPGWSSAQGWHDGQTVGDLPQDIIENILTILIDGTVKLTANCSGTNDPSKVGFWLYTRANPDQPIILTSSDKIDPTKPVKFLIHGWGGNGDVNYIHAIKNAYLQRYDCNVITIDWSVYAAYNYQTSYCYVPMVGKRVAEFICKMSSDLSIQLSSIHVVGHSLGGQTAGFVGSETQKICGSVGRITGLDPAGPGYQNIVPSNRLDATDATFVDVIHTNQGQFGYVGNCGDVDFYPNCGYLQRGCLKLALDETTSIKDIVDLPLTNVDCNHQLSCYVFAESINSNSFKATDCILCGSPLCLKQILGSETYMGESCRSKPKKKEYTLNMNKQSPYAKGPQGPLD